MRPDAHKSKATKRWKAKHGVPAAGAPSAAAAAATSKPSDNRHLDGGSRGGPEPTGPAADHSSGDELEEKPRSRYARRKVESNAFRYHEPTAEEVMAADAGIDRETEELRMLIREAEEEYDPSMYFQFKEERDWANVSTAPADSGIDEFNRSRLQIDFAALEASLSKLPVHVRLNVSKADAVAVVKAVGLGDQDSDGLESEDDQDQEVAVRPAFSTTAPEPAVVPPHQSRDSEGDSASRSHKRMPTAPASIPPLPQPAAPSIPEPDSHQPGERNSPKALAPSEDDLDLLLGTESATLPATPPLLPSESLQPAPPTSAIDTDLKWLDDLLN
ncbi:hypothetical protein HDU87_007421 [Geranomyces variabilis]|uniref:Uncharacterized protein n=1 Tax=Geranomyces variabilis TaxID=109894 RepID=A0AAD5TPX3_9FUNG|nr:hypothetical protein HDU87_007421 [Geranomyces variabilis]